MKPSEHDERLKKNIYIKKNKKIVVTFDSKKTNSVIEEYNLILFLKEIMSIQQHLECKIHDLDQVEIRSISKKSFQIQN